MGSRVVGKLLQLRFEKKKMALHCLCLKKYKTFYKADLFRNFSRFQKFIINVNCSELLLNNPGDSFFFVFGAGHFVGNHSVLDVVRNAGKL